MKILNKISIVVAFTLGLMGPMAAFAATAPTLGNADNFAILAGSAITIGGGVLTSTITGDIGSFPTDTITGIGNATLIGTNHAGDATTQLAKTALTTAYDNAAAQALAGGTTLTESTTNSFNITGTTLTPGIYKSPSTLGLTGTLTLDGGGDTNAVFIFQAVSSLTTAASSVVSLTNGTQACNVFWQVGSTATLGSASTFKGNILALTSIGLGTTANVGGRVLARNGAVTLDGTNVIAKATCAAAIPAATSGGSKKYYWGTINVVKTVINDNGGTKTALNFPLFVNNVDNPPFAIFTPVVSGQTYEFDATDIYYDVTETPNSNYVKSFSGDCDANGRLLLNPDEHKFCVITNDDIGAPVAVPPVPPLIDVVKVPSPLALPNGPGPVTYTYTLRNIGTVPVTDITMVGDTCRPIVLVSGDTNKNSKLEVNETWVYRCSTALLETHTNVVVTTGWANGMSAVDTTSATVVVGASLTPPLIHVVKRPSAFVLSVGGGAVTYTYTVTNPGTVPLSNVSITDDKCTGLPGRVVGHPGDLNKNNLLESNEAWSFTCQSNIVKNTVNTATASGEANGMKARDIAVATVVVAVPGLPNTGIPSNEGDSSWNIVILFGILMAVMASFVVTLRKRVI